jgi:hypothetical protein
MEAVIMKNSITSGLKSWMALPAVALLAIGVSAALNGVHAQNQGDEATTAAAAAYAEFQYATLTGSNNTLNVTMLPVVLGNGSVVYKNLTLEVDVNPTTGAITVASGYPKVTAAPTPQVSSFKAGNYVGPGGTSATQTQLLTVTGPGVTSGGATMWSVSVSPGATGCTYPTTANFYVGSLNSSPLISRLKAAGITSTAYSYGIMGEPACSSDNWWDNGALLGFSQTGNALTIVSFTYGGSEDQATPGSQITYTLLK